MSTRISDRGHTASKREFRAPRQARSRATVDAIIEATARVLALRGYAGCTTNHIAEVAGVSVGSFYQYFSDKDAAVVELANRVADESLAYSWDHIADADNDQSRVDAWLSALAARAANQEGLLRVLFQQVPYIWSTPGVRRAMLGALDVVAQLDPRQQEADDNGHERALIIVKSVVAVLLEIATNDTLRGRRDAVVHELTAMISSYLFANDRAAE